MYVTLLLFSMIWSVILSGSVNTAHMFICKYSVCIFPWCSSNPYCHCYFDHCHHSGNGCAHRSAPKCSDSLNEFLLIQSDRKSQMCTDKNNSAKNRWQKIEAAGNLSVKISLALFLSFTVLFSLVFVVSFCFSKKGKVRSGGFKTFKYSSNIDLSESLAPFALRPPLLSVFFSFPLSISVPLLLFCSLDS